MDEKQLIQKTVLGNAIHQNRERLLKVISWHEPDWLKRQMPVEDILQEVFLDAYDRLDYLNDNPDIPLIVKLRTIALQTIVDKERYYGADKRDINKEVYNNNDESKDDLFVILASAITSPSQKFLRSELVNLVRKVLNEMSPEDRDIIILRHFEQMEYDECAAIMNVTLDAAKMRYSRALKRFKELFEKISGFKP
ncbi:MAG: sigma-70 family RNA polymerase sigma factor [Thermoguttaceae bacterium]|nr:sigma-70 family RNA polymerase sigma factor [Thermoguttaceae bacterium]